MAIEERPMPAMREGCTLVRIAGFIAQGLLRPSIDSSYPLEGFERGYQRLVSRQALGTILLRL
ncbi:hypothetical protein AAFF27_25150 [Xylophilus sp. GW821-FHT01B05]